MEKEEESSTNDTDGVFLPNETKVPPSQFCDQVWSDRSEESFSSTGSLWSPSSRIHLLRLSSSGSDDFEFPFSPYHRRAPLADKKRCEEETKFKRDQPSSQESEMADKVLSVESKHIVNGDAIPAKHTKEQQGRVRIPNEQNTTTEESSGKIKKSLSEDLEPKNAVKMSSVVPPTSHLALRQNFKRQTSNPLTVSIHEETEKRSFPDRQETTFNSVQIPGIIPPTSHLALRRKLKRQASNPLPSGTREESVDATRVTTKDTNHPVLVLRPRAHQSFPICPPPPKSPRKSPVSETRKIKQPTRASKSPRSATVNGKQFTYPESSRVPRTPTNKNHMRSRSVTGEMLRKVKSPSAKHGVTPRERIRSSPVQRNICRPQQRIQSRDRVGSSSKTPQGAWTVGPQGPLLSPRSRAAKERAHALLLQMSDGRSARRALVVGKVLVGKTKDGRRMTLPAIPVESLNNKGFYLVPDVGRVSSAPSGPSSKRCTQPSLPKVQIKRPACKTRSLDASNFVSSRQAGEEFAKPTHTGAGYRKGPQEEKSETKP